MRVLVERTITCREWSESDQRGYDRIVDQATHGSRELFDALSDHEKAVFLKAFRERRDKGVHKNDIANVIWESKYQYKPVSPQIFFQDPYYMGMYGKDLWDRWVEELFFVLNPRNQIHEWILTGGLGMGKTTVSCLAQAYQLFKLACLRDPQGFYGFMKGSDIVIALFNIWIWKAKDDLFSMFARMVSDSPFFMERFPPKKNKSSQNPNPNMEADSLDLPKGLRVVVGASMQYVLGENVFGGILDEMNFKDMSKKDVASAYEAGAKAFDLYKHVKHRIESRWTGGNEPGLVCNVSSKTTRMAFLEKHIEKARLDEHTRVSDFPVWDVKGYCHCSPGKRRKYLVSGKEHIPCDRIDRNYPSKKTFRVVCGDKYRVSKVLKDGDESPENAHIIDVPIEHVVAFTIDPESAMMNIAGISSQPDRPLLAHRDLLSGCFVTQIKHPFTRPTISLDIFADHLIQDFFIKEEVAVNYGNIRGWAPKWDPNAPRFVHVDLAINGCSAGFAMVHCVGFMNTEISTPMGSRASMVPLIQTDIMLEITPPDGSGMIDFEKIRQFVFFLRGLGFHLKRVSFDGFQSAGSIQAFLKSGIEAKVFSLDRTDEGYVILQQAIYHQRFVCYEYPPFVNEILSLHHDIDKKKVLLPDKAASKDVSDAVAGATWSCVKEVAPDFTWTALARGQEVYSRDDVKVGDMSISLGVSRPKESRDKRHKGLTLSDGRPVKRR